MNNVVLKGKLGAGFNDDRYTLPKDGNPGDILVKTETGSEWQKQEPVETLPKDGNPGDILVKTETGSAWEKQEPSTSTPDWNQNDSEASDYIKNRPGGYTVNHPALNIEWDGISGEKVTADIDGMKYVKVSDEIPKIEQLDGGIVSIKNDDVSSTITISDMMIVDYGDGIYGTDMG